MKIGFALTGSFCTVKNSIRALKTILDLGTVTPIISQSIATTDTRFGKATDTVTTLSELCHRAPITTVKDAEPLGPASPLDLLIICPCTGNTLAKLACGITDGAVTMAAKAHLRCDRPLLIALASNDALSSNLKNIATMLNRKCVYFVPMYQDDPKKKPHSLIAEFNLLRPTLDLAMEGKQYQKIFI